MHKKLKDMGNVTLFEDEVVGPELIGTIEYEDGDSHEFYGAIIPTTHRLFIKIIDHNNEIKTKDVMYKEITGVSREDLLLLGRMIHIWIGDNIGVSVKSVSEGRIDRFLEFLYKYRSRELHLEPEQESHAG